MFERWSWPDRGENPNTVEEGQVGGGRAERFRFDYESRKGCGLCVWECPCGAIEMVPKSIWPHAAARRSPVSPPSTVDSAGHFEQKIAPVKFRSRSMRPYPNHEEVEALLTADARARLPLGRQVLVYLNPFALFKDASTGPARVREHARSYNRAMRWMLLPYVRRWTAIGAACFACTVPTEALAGQASVFMIPAATTAVGCCVAVTVVACTLAAYVLLGLRSRESG